MSDPIATTDKPAITDRPDIVIPRTAVAIRAALIEHSPEDLDRFETEFHTAMAEADDDFDLSRVSLTIGRWWAAAMVRANPDPATDAAWERINLSTTENRSTTWHDPALTTTIPK
jgi:hypothetical protein